ncbi:hypothetical protein ACG3RN_24675 [Pseudomonas aeruginosa]
MRKPLLKLWREARAQHGDPVNAWPASSRDAAKACKSYKSQRGLGGLRPFQLGRGHRDHRRGQRLAPPGTPTVRTG